MQTVKISTIEGKTVEWIGVLLAADRKVVLAQVLEILAECVSGATGGDISR